MTSALVSPPVLRWARQRARLNLEIVGQKTHVAADKIASWESGEARPTFKQAQSLAKALHVPFGYFFLSQPPQETLAIPDFRTVGSREKGSLSSELREVVTEALRRQDWFRDYLKEQGAEVLPMVGKFVFGDEIETVAHDIVRTLKLSMADRDGAPRWEDFLGLLFDRAEAAGISILRSGIVGNNTHRPLLVEDFRGFALCDPLAPLIFLNGADAPAAQFFTFAHELAHIWTGQSGIGETRPEVSSAAFLETERFCDVVAAEVLVPQAEFQQRWNRNLELAENARALSRIFRVSPLVTARRALDLGMVPWESYDGFYRAEIDLWHGTQQGRGGGDYYRNIPARNGRRLTAAVVTKALQREMLWRDAARLLAIQPSQIQKLAEEMDIR